MDETRRAGKRGKCACLTCLSCLIFSGSTPRKKRGGASSTKPSHSRNTTRSIKGTAPKGRAGKKIGNSKTTFAKAGAAEERKPTSF